MPLHLILLFSIASAAVILLLLLLIAGLRRALLRPPIVLLVTVSALILSGLSWVISQEGAAGTGTRTRYGYPKPYYFTWQSSEHPVRYAGFNPLYFAGNTLAYAVCLSWLAVGVALLKTRAAPEL